MYDVTVWTIVDIYGIGEMGSNEVTLYIYLLKWRRVMNWTIYLIIFLGHMRLMFTY
jgi:hypothetical protein